MTERKVMVEVPFERSMRNTIGIAAKILYKQECEDEYCSQMLSERKGDKVIVTMTFKKKNLE